MSREAKILIGILVVVVAGMIGLFMLTNSGSGPSSTGQTADQSKLVNDSSHKSGSGSVTVVEFGDYQCPACGQAHPTVQRLKEEYKDKMTFVFRNFPLDNIHPNANAAAYAAEAAAKQNKFWEMHDMLYEKQQEWENSNTAADIFVKYADELGLDITKFKEDVGSEAVKKIVAADKADGEAVNVQGTPTFFVNGQQSANFSYDTLKGLIENAK